MMKNTVHPDVVGSYTVNGQTHFHAATLAELDRSGHNFGHLLGTFGFAPGRFVLTVSLVQEAVQFAPFEVAMTDLGLYGTNSDYSPYDAGRVESLSRQVDFVAACGVGKDTLEGLAMFGHDPEKVFGGRTVWARADAYDALKAIEGIDVRRCVFLGPAMALECAHGGVHFDSREWAVEDRGGTLHLSSHLQRVEPVDSLDTGVAGRLSAAPCGCGSLDPAIALD